VKEETAKERKNRELIEAGQIPEEDDDDPSDEDGVVVDYQIEFCRDMLLQANSTDRRQQLQQAKPFGSSAGPPSRRRCARRSRRWG